MILKGANLLNEGALQEPGYMKGKLSSVSHNGKQKLYRLIKAYF